MTALGEACVKVLSDRGSIPLASTNKMRVLMKNEKEKESCTLLG